MEFTSHSIEQTREKSRAFSQITLDDDYIVKDSCPDVVKIIHTKGSIACEEVRLAGQSLYVTGKLQFQVLYRSDNEHSRLETLSGTIPFQEKMVMDGAGDLDPVAVSGEIEDLSVGVINSRKLSIRAVANLRAGVEERTTVQIAGGVSDSGQVQEKIEDREILELLAAKKDVIRFHGEAKLPGAKPEIGRLLWHEEELRNVECGMESGRIHVRGDIYFAALYLCMDGMQIQWTETMLPFAQEVGQDVTGGPDPVVLWVTIHPENTEVEPVNDYDGESRIFGIDMVFGVGYKAWRERKIPVLCDAYALDRTLKLVGSPCEALGLLVKNEAKMRRQETVSLEPNQNKILQIVSGTGSIAIDRAAVEEGGIRFEGVLTVSVLYLTPEDNFPVAYTACVIPFEQFVEVNGIQKDTWYDYTTVLDQLQINLLDSSEYEVKAAMRITVLACSRMRFDTIDRIEEEPLALDALAQIPGLVGYVVQEGEELWDIAKRYRTTVDEIAAVNQLKSPSVLPGTKLLLVKQCRG